MIADVMLPIFSAMYVMDALDPDVQVIRYAFTHPPGHNCDLRKELDTPSIAPPSKKSTPWVRRLTRSLDLHCTRSLRAQPGVGVRKLATGEDSEHRR